ncbi:acyl-CoA dehydrogenase family protein [candidate division WOR-3 bacterium]|nr:acyl-CoA dehydrogenase family protein [candidate division WOR-3 bacterium]
MKLSQECILLQRELRKFAQQTLADKVDELDKSCRFPLEDIKDLANMGMLGAIIPETYGGAAMDATGLTVVLEELSKVCASTAFVIASHNAFFVYPVLKFGREEMKKRYLPGATRGEFIGGYALHRTNELSLVDAADGPCISGRNPFVLNAAADGPLVVALPEGEANNSTVYVLDKGTPGCRSGRPGSTIGLKAAGLGEYIFEKCCPAAADMIGEVRQGAKVLESMHDYARVSMSAIALGIAQGAADAAVKYARERVQFERPIINFGMVREQVSDMITNIESARHLVYEAARRIDQGEDYRSAAAMAMLVAGRAATATTTTAIQVYGGYGYMKDYPAERFFRDAQMINVICSTPDEDKEIIAKGTL